MQKKYHIGFWWLDKLLNLLLKIDEIGYQIKGINMVEMNVKLKGMKKEIGSNNNSCVILAHSRVLVRTKWQTPLNTKLVNILSRA